MLESRRGALGLDWKSLAVFLAYLLMVVYGILHYQPWEDEGRAWMDVRHVPLARLTFHYLRYEGHPVLWYWLLWPLPRLHVSFLVINWIAGAAASGAIYLLLRFCPFPFYVRALLPFTFALGYEYAIVGRSYSLFPLLGFWVAHLFRQKSSRPLHMALALALLANLAVHGTIVAGCFALAYIVKQAVARRKAGVSLRPNLQELTAATAFAASLVFVVIVVFPPRDLGPRANPRFMKAFRHIFPAATIAPPRPRLFQTVSLIGPGGITPERPGVEVGLSLRERLHLTFIYPIATFAPLALLFEVLVCVYLVRRRQPLLILAPLLLSVFLIVVYSRLWHTGLIWITLLMVLWAAWDEAELPSARTLQTGVAALLALLCVLQLSWTFHALRWETAHSTYPAEATANFLRQLPPGKRIDGYDHAFTVLPYFERPILNRQAEGLTSVPQALADRPDVILLRETSITPDAMSQILAAGYRQTHSFCGTPYFPNQPLEPTCFLVLEKS